MLTSQGNLGEKAINKRTISCYQARRFVSFKLNTQKILQRALSLFGSCLLATPLQVLLCIKLLQRRGLTSVADYSLDAHLRIVFYAGQAVSSVRLAISQAAGVPYTKPLPFYVPLGCYFVVEYGSQCTTEAGECCPIGYSCQ